MARVRSKISDFARTYSNIHRQGDKPNIFLKATPRSGSTWLMELLYSQPNTKMIAEPLNLRNPSVAEFFGTDLWDAYYQEPMNPKLEDYFTKILQGKPSVGFLNTFPFRHRNYRVMTNRIVFKMLHGMEDRLNWLKDNFQAKVVLLLRHPIAVSLSRETFPRLESFMRSEYSRHFSQEQLALAKEIMESGSKLEKGMLSWCLQNGVPLKQADQDWTIVTYEQLTLEPEKVLPVLIERLDLEDGDIDQMIAELNKPSSSATKSDKETQAKLNGIAQSKDKGWLVEKWRKKVNEEEEARLMGILEAFEIDAYEFGSFLPTEKYWL